MPEERDSQETTDISQFFSESYTVSKRQLGIVLLLVGVVGFVGILAIDLVDFGREGGIGPAQQAALAILAMVAIVGVLLIPLGDKPA